MSLHGAARHWEDPSVIGINKRKPHVPLRSFPDAAAALEHYRLRSGETLCPCHAAACAPGAAHVPLRLAAGGPRLQRGRRQSAAAHRRSEP